MGDSSKSKLFEIGYNISSNGDKLVYAKPNKNSPKAKGGIIDANYFWILLLFVVLIAVAKSLMVKVIKFPTEAQVRWPNESIRHHLLGYFGIYIFCISALRYKSPCLSKGYFKVCYLSVFNRLAAGNHYDSRGHLPKLW